MTSLRAREGAHVRLRDGGLDEIAEGRFLEVARGFQANVPHHVPAAFQQPLRVGQGRPILNEAEREVIRAHQDRDDGLRGALGRTESDDEPVPVVVHHLDRAGHELSQARQRGAPLLGDGWGVLRHERRELHGRRVRRHRGGHPPTSPRRG